jgi:hypothetical protein
VRVADADAVRIEVRLAVADSGVALMVAAEPVMPLSENSRVSVADGVSTESDDVRIRVAVALFMTERDSDADAEGVLVGVSGAVNVNVAGTLWLLVSPRVRCVLDGDDVCSGDSVKDVLHVPVRGHEPLRDRPEAVWDLECVGLRAGTTAE